MKIIKGDQVAWLHIHEFGLIHAGPTSGKTTLIANFDDYWLLDPDTWIWGPILSSRDNDILKGLPKAPWYETGVKRLQWNAIGHGAKLAVALVAKAVNATIVTNQFYRTWLEEAKKSLGLSSPDVLLPWGQSVTVFRSPEEMMEISKERAKRRGKKTGKGNDITMYRSWYQSWKKHHNEYDVAVELEPGEYLTDVFGLNAIVTDPTEVDNISYKKMAAALAEFLEITKKFNNPDPQGPNREGGNHED